MDKGTLLVSLLMLVALAFPGCGSTPEPTPSPPVTPRPPAPTPTAQPTFTALAEPTPTLVPKAVVTADALNLRAGPGTNYDQLGMLKLGEELQATGRNQAGDWIAVIAPGGTTAWVAVQYVSLNVSVETLPVAPAP